MKKILIPLLLLVFVFSLAEDANAQRKKRRKKKEDKEESVRSKRSRDRNADEENYISFKDKLVYDINIGNIALSMVISEHLSNLLLLINYMIEFNLE